MLEEQFLEGIYNPFGEDESDDSQATPTPSPPKKKPRTGKV